MKTFDLAAYWLTATVLWFGLAYVMYLLARRFTPKTLAKWNPESLLALAILVGALFAAIFTD